MIALGSFDRPTALTRLADTHFDLLVVGGGITGAGVALDAAARGLRTALVERDDFASGTSSKSSKLVHGGLRYLQQGEVALVYQALHERQRLLRNAPHLVHVLPFLIPILTKDGVINRKLARAMGWAMWMYDFTGGLRIGKLHKRLSPDEAVAYMPTLRQDHLASAYLFYDAQADDARLTLTIARTAALDHGAVVVNGAAITRLHKDGERVSGATVEADGRSIEVEADVVVNATGVWSDEVRRLDEGAHPHSSRPAKGVHLTVPWHLVRNEIAAIVPVPGDRRSVFVVPWGDLTYVGTTDTDYDGPLEHPTCTADDVAYLLRALNGAMGSDLSPDDVVGTWAGLRPLVKDASSSRTADLSRRHKVLTSPSGLISINGGKLTTYREMSADTVDATLHLLGDRVRGRVRRRSPTKRLRLRGAEGHAEAGQAKVTGLAEDDVEHLASRFGGEARVLFAMIEADPTLAERIVPPLPYLAAEVVYAARHEMSRSVDDVLSRRTRARLLARDDSAAAASAVAELMAGALGWTKAEQARQVKAYRGLVDDDREAADLPEQALELAVGS